jgi:hypothetical protein
MAAGSSSGQRGMDARNIVFVLGYPGSGKTTQCLQYAFVFFCWRTPSPVFNLGAISRGHHGGS